MVILGTYEEAVKMMGDLTFLQALVNFPKENINDETVELLQVGWMVWLGWHSACCACNCVWWILEALSAVFTLATLSSSLAPR